MINHKIEITIYRSKTDFFDEEKDRWDYKLGEWTSNFDDIIDSSDWRETKLIFTKFTNKGKVSKTDDNFNSRFAPEAEKLFQEWQEIIAETEKDMTRALELAEIVNNADFNEELRIVSTKTSRSEWYKHAGEFNMRSQYSKMVPVSVLAEAKELQAIRKKHQGNKNFDFYATEYKYIEEREADHENF